MAVFGIASENVNDEISNFQMGRYVSTNEALWRLLSFQIHERYPTVVHLAVHLENGQRVYFTEANAAQRAERPPSTTLTSFFAMCEADSFAATLMYVEMPKYYTWNQSTKKFQRRKQGTPVTDWPQVFSTDALGRMYTVHPRNDECFYLRLLLVNVRGPKSFAHLKTVNGHQCQTYREACQLLGLLENDSHWDLTLADSVVSSNAYQIRTLFAIIITTCFPSQPIQLWNKYKDAICEDILHRLRIQTNNPDIQITDEIYNEGLILIEDQCLTIANKLLIEVGMIAPNRSMHDAFNQELNRELQYNVDTLQEFVRNNVPLLNEQQKQVYETLMPAVDNNTGGLFFLDAPGGTGKTFVISLILATIRSRCDIALALASSGIAATLLDGGRTAHSALKLPLNLNTIDTPTCNISRSSAMGKLLMQCKLIVWDECTMAHKKSLEALNFTLKDLRRNNNIFGGLMILLAGDFRQTLPVVPRGTPADELNACLKASPLWNNVKTLSLTTNMRVQLQNDQSAAQFFKQLLDLGNGKVPVDATSGLITLTNDFCRFVDTQLVLIENVFPNISENYKNYAWLSQRAILAAKNNDVHALNFTIQSKIAGDLVTYKSVDSITNPDDVVNYPTEFLNSLEIPGFPPHNLQLKVGTVIMILRNLNPPRLCNGTRLSVKRLMPNLIEATIINGKYAGEENYVPDMKRVGLWDDIGSIRSALTYHTESLMFNLNNNAAENYNSILAKFVGGKRVNLCLRGSYELRCNAAVTAYNVGANRLSLFHKQVAQKSPGLFTKRYIKKTQRLKTKILVGPAENYGAVEPDLDSYPDLSLSELNDKKILYLNTLNTKRQHECEDWHRERKKRLTASVFGKICKLRKTTSRAKTIESLLYGTFQGNLATKYGVEHEEVAKEQLANILGVNIEPSGLFVDSEQFYLAASPDGLIGDDGLMEIKCPSSAKSVSPKEAIENKIIKCCVLKNNETLHLKKNDNYYYQIQGALHISRRDYCYFCIWTPKGILYEKIFRDDNFWVNSMEPQLSSFYMNSMILELIDSRYDRGLPIRDGL
ncbi:hypothetical protein QTP88_011827 [Uroleucon formosanum]